MTILTRRGRKQGWWRVPSVLSRHGLSAALALVLLGTAVFLALRVLPGDMTSLVLGEDASEEARRELRHRLGLDQSLWQQWLGFVGGAVRAELGDSLARPGLTAAAAVRRALLPTAQLASLAVALGTLMGVLAGTCSVGILGARGRSVVHAGILTFASIPLLAFGPLLTWIFAVRFELVPLPGDPQSGLQGLLFASTLLSFPLGAQVARVTRASLIDQCHARYLDVARAKGAGPMRVWLLHALPVAAPTVLVVIAMQLGALLGGAIVLERLFERPGLGTLMLDAYRSRDLPVLQAGILAAGALFILAQLFAQLLQLAIAPGGDRGGDGD